MARLSYQERKDLPASEFVFPETRDYPIPDEAHGRDALARVSANGTPEQKAKVRAAVHRKFPDIEMEGEEHGEQDSDGDEKKKRRRAHARRAKK